MAGDVKTLDPEARLGFYRYQMEKPDTVQTLNIGEEMEKDRSYFAGRGV